MIGALARKFFGSANDRRVKGYQGRVDAINAIEPELSALSDEALKARTAEFRQQLADGRTLDDILVPAFATVREAARRTLEQRHFDESQPLPHGYLRPSVPRAAFSHCASVCNATPAHCA